MNNKLCKLKTNISIQFVPSAEIDCTKLSGKTPTLPFNSPFHQPLSGRSLLKIVMISPSFKSNSSSFVGL